MTPAVFLPDLIIAVDWSAASQPRPKKPSADACWIAWAFRDDDTDRRPPPEYFRTRASCEARITDLLASHAGSTFLGFDFPLGYPVAIDGAEVLPVGRQLCQHLDSLIEDEDTNHNNRFDIAEALNEQIAERFAEPHGPFWGCPPTRDSVSSLLLPTKRVMRAVPEYRAVEQLVRTTRRLGIQSPWKLYTTGSVGSQMLLGLPVIHRLLANLGDRGRLLPFEQIDRLDAVVITEIWPSLHNADITDHPIKDARQVLATRDAMFSPPAHRPGSLHTGLMPEDLPEVASREGWIAGVHSSDNSDSHTV